MEVCAQGEQEQPLRFPPAYSCAAPFGVDTGGTNPAFWAVANSAAMGYSQYDSWLTVGITEGDTSSKMGAVGIQFEEWDLEHELVSDADTGGAVFWMDPGAAVEAVEEAAHPHSSLRSMVVAQLTVPADSAPLTALFSAQGRSQSNAHGQVNWEQNCISVTMCPDAGECHSQTAPGSHGPQSLRPVSDTPWLSARMPSTSACPLQDLRAEISELDAICCDQQACDADINHGAPAICSAGCATKLESLFHSCNSTLDAVFDGMDGTLDGRAELIHNLRERCDQIRASDVILELKELQAKGCDVDANGVGEMAVPEGESDPKCKDTGAHKMCSLVHSGTLSCSADFCEDCPHAGECDRSCGLCNRRSLQSTRQLQIDLNTQCSVLNLQSRVEPVNEACCDEDGTCAGGGMGIPTVCDAKCAIVYAPFYEECEATLRQSFGAQPEVFSAFSRLKSTCERLPVPALLVAASRAVCADTEPLEPPVDAGFGAWLDEQLDCPLAMVEGQAVRIDDACCDDGAGGCTDSGPEICGVRCAIAATDTCSKTMDLLLDGADGTRDGHSNSLANLRSQCSSLSVTDVLLLLNQMQDDEGCTLAVDGVGETTVLPFPQSGTGCADTAPSSLCSLIDVGVLKCSEDFCLECAHAGECDRSCGFCSDGDSEEENVIVPGGGHRRAQITIRDQTCDVLDISTRTDDVNTACCDETNDHCAAGVPTTCDARCAMTFLP